MIKENLNLPKTSFSMKANLPHKEPDIVNFWDKIDLYKKRLGVIGDWKNYYSTMSFEAEAGIVRELGKFLLEGSLYKGFKPILWSTVEKTALF